MGKTIEILQSVLATELVCWMRYSFHAITASGISSEGVKAEFAEHAEDERGHAMEVAERINQLGGKPNFNPEGLLTRSASQYVEGANLIDMIKENLIAERIAVDHYPRADPLFRQRRSRHQDDDPAHPAQGRRACRRHARPADRPPGQADAGQIDGTPAARGDTRRRLLCGGTCTLSRRSFSGRSSVRAIFSPCWSWQAPSCSSRATRASRNI
ncbi:MAG: ferritin-like domain-containing protein [Rhizomicrobium sp.]